MAAAAKSTVPDITKTLQDQTLNALRQSQAVAVEAVAAWAKAAEKTTEQMPALPAVPGVPAVDELIASSFDFASELLATQRKFTEDVLAAAAPAAPKVKA